MPIELQSPVGCITEKEFHDLDYEAMRVVFDVHNNLGRFYDEVIYQTELCRICQNAGITTDREFEIKLIHRGYQKSLFTDLLINSNTVYELKAIKQLIDPNRIQTLNYLFATDTHHGKLVNFRPKSVEHEFVSTKLNHDKRRDVAVRDKDWKSGCYTDQLRDIAIDLLNDWGAFFDTDIYLEAICHFLGGRNAVVREVDIFSGNLKLGSQKIPLLNDREAFRLTSIHQNETVYRDHLIRFLKHTNLDTLHWVNLNHSDVTFRSLERKSFCP